MHLPYRLIQSFGSAISQLVRIRWGRKAQVTGEFCVICICIGSEISRNYRPIAYRVPSIGCRTGCKDIATQGLYNIIPYCAGWISCGWTGGWRGSSIQIGFMLDNWCTLVLHVYANVCAIWFTLSSAQRRIVQGTTLWFSANVPPDRWFVNEQLLFSDAWCT